MPDTELAATAREALTAIRSRRPPPPPAPVKPAYVIVSTRLADNPMVCEGKRCQSLIPEGGPVTLVYHEARWLRNPEGRDVQASLCGDCAECLGANTRLFVTPGPPREPVGFVWHKKSVPAF